MQIEVRGNTRPIMARRTTFTNPRDWDHQTVADTWTDPLTENGRNFLQRYNRLRSASDAQLLNIMWNQGGLDLMDSIWLRASLLKTTLENHFRGRSGNELTVRLPNSYWNVYLVNDRDSLMRQIAQRIEQRINDRSFRMMKNGTVRVDVSDLLTHARLSFRTDATNPSMTIAMGGVQEVQVRSLRSRLVSPLSARTGQYWPATTIGGRSLATTKHLAYTINLQIVLRDWFGVDEDDFAANDWIHRPGKTLVTSIGREALTAFWILQHQRGFNPFVWNAVFEQEITVHAFQFAA